MERCTSGVESKIVIGKPLVFDVWLHEELSKAFDKVLRDPIPDKFLVILDTQPEFPNT